MSAQADPTGPQYGPHTQKCSTIWYSCVQQPCPCACPSVALAVATFTPSGRRSIPPPFLP